MSEETPNAPKVPLLERIKMLAVGLVVGLLIGGIGAGKVWLDLSGAVSEAREAAQVAEANAASRLEAQKAELAKTKGAVLVHRARIEATETLAALLQQNYGSAGEHLQQVRSLLEALDPDQHGLDPAKLEAARKASRATNIEVAGDLAEQVRLLRALNTAIDALAKQ